MQVIDQSHEILHITPNILELVELGGRNCWKSEGKITPGSAQRFAEMLHKKNHGSPLEHSQITVRLITDRGVMAELTRHRVGIAFSVESTRYLKYDDEMVFIRPVWCSEKVLGHWKAKDLASDKNLDSTDLFWLRACNDSDEWYKALLEEKWQPQKARQVLNNSLKTDIVMSANIRSMQHILKLRTSKAAHPQIRDLMFGLLGSLQKQVPIVFDDIILKNGMEGN